MADTIPPLSVTEEKGIRIVEFTNSKILDEANIAEIGNTLNVLIDENENPKLLLDFASRQARKQPCQLDIADLDAPLVTAFLQHL